MKSFLSLACVCCCFSIFAAPRPADKPFAENTKLNYSFMPAQKMELLNGIVRTTEETALPDIDAKYSRQAWVNGRTFTLPGELCETMSACYKADLNGDKVPDYVFVNIKVWNGRCAGQSDVGVFVSNPEKKYTFNAFETQHLEAEVVNGKVMLIKYDYSDDNESLIRQFYTFNAAGEIRLHQAEKFTFQR